MTPLKTRSLAAHEEFVKHVQKVCRNDPGKRAALRSGLGLPPEKAYRMHAIVAPWVDDSHEPTERAYYTVASLIAAQTRDARMHDDQAAAQGGEEEATREPGPSLGRALGTATKADGSRRPALAGGSAEKRLHLLVRQGLDGVHRHLPPIVRILRTAGVPVDWARLIDELSRWPHDHDRIAKAWLQDYYRAVGSPNGAKGKEQE